MNISDAGIKLIKQFESCSLKAYKALDTEMYYTIGWGHYGNDVKKGMTITQAKADQMLKDDLEVFTFAINKMLKVDVTQNMFDALTSFAYNCGTSALKNSSLLALVNKKDFKGASNEFDKWVHSGGKVIQGLVKRRAIEKALFLKNAVIKPVIQTYTVRAGENLTKIAQRQETTVKELLKLNPKITNKDLIRTGQKIYVPVK